MGEIKGYFHFTETEIQAFLITHYTKKYGSLRTINVKFLFFLTSFRFCIPMKSLASFPLVWRHSIYTFIFDILTHFHFSLCHLQSLKHDKVLQRIVIIIVLKSPLYASGDFFFNILLIEWLLSYLFLKINLRNSWDFKNKACFPML